MICKYRRIIFSISIFLIFFILIWLAYSLSFQWNKYDNKSYPDFIILSQFISGFGALFAVLVALFLNQIKRVFETTTIIINNNLALDKNFDFKNYEVHYYTHLRISNPINNILIKECQLYLEPQKIANTIVDIPISFFFPGQLKNKNIYDSDTIDFAFFKLEFASQIRAELILRIDDYRNTINILENPSISLKISANSPSFNKVPRFKVSIIIDRDELLKFINDIKTNREVYINGNNHLANEFEEKFDKQKLIKFYDLLKIEVKRIYPNNKDA